MGPYGSQKSLQRYQGLLKEWEEARHRQASKRTDASASAVPPDFDIGGITAVTLRQKRLVGAPIALSELILVFHGQLEENHRLISIGR